MLAWLSGRLGAGPGRSSSPPPADRKAPEVQLDYVGSLRQRRQGDRRPAPGREAARLLRQPVPGRAAGRCSCASGRSRRSSRTARSGLDERRRAEQAFAQRQNCVIVATSSLELGIDVGDLDRVIQIDAPATVSSFLQRMGRTGRRAGNATNCLFLATTDEALLRAAALVDLWRQGYVEPCSAPPEPYHILAQQLMALCLQERGIGRTEWFEWVAIGPRLRADGPGRRHDARGLHARLRDPLERRGHALAFAPEGEAKYGRQELHGPALGLHVAAALHGDLAASKELGSVHESTFFNRDDGPPVLAAGRSELEDDPPGLEAADRPRRADRAEGAVPLAGRGAVPGLPGLPGDPGDPGGR